jgi:hypothetical protein
MIDIQCAQEIVYECQQYTLRDYRCLGIHGSHLYLIQDRVTDRYNIYSLDHYVKNWYKFEEFLVENYIPIDISYAIYFFPNYCFTYVNYGF